MQGVNKITNEINPMLTIAGGGITIVCPLLGTEIHIKSTKTLNLSLLAVLCLCVCWSQHRSRIGKLSLVGGCSSIGVFDGSLGSLSIKCEENFRSR